MQQRGKKILPKNVYLQEGTQQNTVHQEALDMMPWAVELCLLRLLCYLSGTQLDCFAVH